MTAQMVLGALGIMAVMILIQLGRRPVRAATFVLPLALAWWVAHRYLPTAALAPADAAAAWAGAAAGALLGAVAGAFVRVTHDAAANRTYMQATWPYVVIWLALGLGRLAFAWAATSFARQPIGAFIVAQHMTGAGIQACFIAMALATVVARTVVLALKVAGRHLLPVIA